MGRRDAGIGGVELVVVGEGGVVRPGLGLRRAGVREPVEVLVVRAAGLGRLRRARRVHAGALGRLLQLEHRLLLVRVAAPHHGVVLLDEGVHLEIIELIPIVRVSPARCAGSDVAVAARARFSEWPRDGRGRDRRRLKNSKPNGAQPDTFRRGRTPNQWCTSFFSCTPL